MQVGPKLVHLGSPEQFFAVSSENIDFQKNLFNMKIFSIKFVIKKVMLIFGVRWPSSPKKRFVSPKFFWSMWTNFWPNCNKQSPQLPNLRIVHTILYSTRNELFNVSNARRAQCYCTVSDLQNTFICTEQYVCTVDMLSLIRKQLEFKKIILFEACSTLVSPWEPPI